jgi:hypothetical protein
MASNMEMLYRHYFSILLQNMPSGMYKEMKPEVNETHQLLVNVADINLLGDSVHTITEKTETH